MSGGAAKNGAARDARRFIRHPTSIPIEVRGGAGKATGARTHDVSLGGLSIEVDWCLEPGELVELRVPTVSPPFETRGRVAWCRRIDSNYEMGVQFLEASDAFRARMVEQVCHIEQFRSQVREREGRELSAQEAAAEWIREHAADFPNPGRESTS